MKTATRNMFYDEQGKHRRTKKEILDEQGNLRAGCSIIPKGEVYESHIFTKKDEWFKSDAFTREVKEMFTEIINSHVKEESEKLSVFQQGGVYLATKKIGKNNPKEAEIQSDNAARQEWNRTVDVALVEGVPEEDILTVKREKITDKTLQSIRTYGWLPDMFQQIIRGAKGFLQEMIFKFKLPPKPVPKIDLQEWNDMRKLMEKLQKQSQAMKSTQQEISSLKKQLSETTGFFKGKARKSLESKIEQAEKQKKRIHMDMEQTVKRQDIQMFNPSQRHIRDQKNWSGNTMRNCVHGKIRQNRRKKSNQNRRKRQAYGKNYTAISRKAGNSQNKLQRKNLWTENDEKGGTENEENNF